jgi:hypothetical protein
MNLHRFNPLPKEYDIKEDIVRLDDLFQQVDLVTGAPLSEIYKSSYFMCHFQHDPRPMVTTRIQTLDFTKCNYNDMYRAIHEPSVVSPLPVQRPQRPSAQRATTSAVTSRKVLASFLTAFTNMSSSMPMPHRLLLFFQLRIPSHRPCPLRHDTTHTSRVSIAVKSERLPTPRALPSESLTAHILTPVTRLIPDRPALSSMPPVPLVATNTLAFSCFDPHRPHPLQRLL